MKLKPQTFLALAVFAHVAGTAVFVHAQPAPPSTVIVETPPGTVRVQSAPVIVSQPRVVQTVQPSNMYWCNKCQSWHTRQSIGRTVARTGGSYLPKQATAVERANRMARFNLRRHPPGSFGASFEGVGWSSNPNATPATCRPGGRGKNAGVANINNPNWVLVGDATARGRFGSYRVRLWDRRR